MAKRRKKGRKAKKKISIGVTAGAAAYAINTGRTFIDGTPKDKVPSYLITRALGVRFDKATTDGSNLQWDNQVFIETWGPIMIGMGISIVGSKLGLNKYLKNVPFIGNKLKF